MDEYKLRVNSVTDYGKYIISKQGSELVFDALGYDDLGRKGLLHKHIAKHKGLEEEAVLGGGKVSINEGGLCIYDYSVEFGSIPKKLLDAFESLLKKAYSDKGIVIGEYSADQGDGLIGASHHPSVMNFIESL